MSFNLFLKVALSSMIPVTELRATIPIFIAKNPEVSIWFIFVAAVFGNMIPNFFILWFLPRFNSWLHNHAAPRINKIVIHLHNYFIKNKRLPYFYFSVGLLTAIGLVLLKYFNVVSLTWYIAILLGIPLWAYILFTIAHKAYEAALKEKSIIHWFYNKVRKEHSAKFYHRGSIALILIVGIPIPGTGSWTGSLLAFLFNIPYWKAVGLIFLGVLMAGLIVTGLSTGIINSLGYF